MAETMDERTLALLLDSVKVALLQPEWMDLGGSELCPLCGGARPGGGHNRACLRVRFRATLAEPHTHEEVRDGE